jgi:cytochrome b561
MALETRLPQIIFGHQGSLPTDFWAFPIRYAHYGFSRLLMALIALHIAGALYHTFILKDGLLRRMGFGKRRIDAVQSTPALHREVLEVQQ